MNGTRCIMLAGLIGMFLVGVPAAPAGELPTLVYEIPAPYPGYFFFGKDLSPLYGDVDGDDVPDFAVVAGLPGDGWGYVLSGVDGRVVAQAAATAAVAGTGDLDGHGTPDWAGVWQDASQPEDSLFAYSGTLRGEHWPEDAMYSFTELGTFEVAGNNGRVVVGGMNHYQTPRLDDVLIFNGAVPDVQAWLTRAPFHLFGTCLANVGDWDGDGQDDYAIGEPGHPSDTRPGTILIVSGAVSTPEPMEITALGPADLLLTVTGPGAGDHIGYSIWSQSPVANVGDLTGDGVDDLVVGAPLASAGGMTENGSVLIYDVDFEAQTFSALLLDRLHGTLDGGHFGNAVATAGDLNSDGVPDFAVGSYASEGKVYFYSGADRQVLGTLDGQLGFGFTMAVIGDLEADGRINLAISNHFARIVYVYNAGWMTRQADFDFDEDVDLADFLIFQQCFTGSNNRYGRNCRICDLDNDGDVDLSDFTIFQLHFTGSL